ncbi:hypothetical protein PMAYCL1PPCAC_19297, partial [Pristionchus mayeri]
VLPFPSKMSARVRFSSQPRVTHANPASPEASLEHLMNMPLPSIRPDEDISEAYQGEIAEPYHVDILESSRVDIFRRCLIRNNDSAKAVNRTGPFCSLLIWITLTSVHYYCLMVQM